MMDRWEIDLEDEVVSTELEGDPMPYNIINNYFSVGVVSLFFIILYIIKERKDD
jgi:diacylglycerol kinase (ATP)